MAKMKKIKRKLNEFSSKMTKLEFFQKKIQRKVPKCQNYRVLSKKFREKCQNTKNTEKMPKYRANIKIQSNRDLCLIYFLKDKGTCKSMDICEVTVHALIIGGALWSCQAQETQKI